MSSTIRVMAFRKAAWACLLFLVCFAAKPYSVGAQSANTENTLRLDDSEKRPAASIEELDWLAGFWRANDGPGLSEEVWMPPSHGSMAGAFKDARDGSIVFYEFVEIVEEESSLTLKVKHFDSQLVGWEEKEDFVSFPLVQLGENEAFFSGLTYRRVGDELRAFVAIQQDDGSLGEIGFIYSRQDINDTVR